MLSNHILVLVIYLTVKGNLFTKASINIIKDEPNKISSCVAKLSTGELIDLSSLDDPSHPRSVVDIRGGQIYKFNPCSGIICGKTSTVAICQTSADGLVATDYGDQSSASFSIINQNDLVISYSSRSSGLLKNSNLQCFCGTGDSFLLVSSSGNTQNFRFTSKCCCPDGCKGKKKKSGLSFGSILLIIGFVLLIVYLVGGVMFMTFAKKQTGLQMMPNSSFWLAIPGNIKDGFSFAVQKIRLKNNGYESV